MENLLKKATMKQLAQQITDAKSEVRDKLAYAIGGAAADTFMKANYDTFSKFTRAATYGR